MPEYLNYEALNPGVRCLVRLLRAAGFDTCDSGDGVTREFECDPGHAYVVMEVNPVERLTQEADRLVRELAALGVKLEPINEDGTSPSVQADYHPIGGRAFLVLVNVTDATLAAGGAA